MEKKFPTKAEIEARLGVYLPDVSVIEKVNDEELLALLKKWQSDIVERQKQRNPFPLLRTEISKVLCTSRAEKEKETELLELIREFECKHVGLWL